MNRGHVMAAASDSYDEARWMAELASPILHPRGIATPANPHGGRLLEFQRLTAHVGTQARSMTTEIAGIISGPGFYWTWLPGISQNAYLRDDELTFAHWSVEHNVNAGPRWRRWMLLTAAYLSRGLAPHDASLVALAWLLPTVAVAEAAQVRMCVTALAKRMHLPEPVVRVRVHELLGSVCPRSGCARHAVTPLSAVA